LYWILFQQETPAGSFLFNSLGMRWWIYPAHARPYISNGFPCALRVSDHHETLFRALVIQCSNLTAFFLLIQHSNNVLFVSNAVRGRLLSKVRKSFQFLWKNPKHFNRKSFDNAP
jgi:hypothetical protein